MKIFNQQLILPILPPGILDGTYKETNKYFEARVAHIWKLKDGKIISFEQFVDSKTVMDAMKNDIPRK